MLALAWPSHIHHDVADAWFSANRAHGWATCPHTQLGFLRLSAQPAVAGVAISVSDAQAVLTANLAEPDHEFWSLDYPVTAIRSEIRDRIVGHKQLADALLLDLAIRRQGRLATFDKRITRLLPSDSPYMTAIEILSLV